MSADRKLLSAYEKISSTRITERSSGLSELKTLLLQKRNAGHLNDKGFHKMYETIFKAAVTEKSLFPKQSRMTKASSGTRLQSCGAVLRAAVELGVEKIKAKTARAVFSHIIETLPYDDGICDPIATDYTKALRILLEYSPHTEHITHDEWADLAKFCCTHVRIQLELPDEYDAESREMADEDRNRRGRDILLMREDSRASRRSTATADDSQSTPQKKNVIRLSHPSEELLLCLKELLSIPNAPLLFTDTLTTIVDTLLGFLEEQPSNTRAHQHVFSSLNYVLNIITVNDMKVVIKVSEVIIPIISRMWRMKTTVGLREEMIISILYCRPHIRSRIRTLDGARLRNKVEDLFDSMCSEYIAQSEREILQLDDVTFPDPSKGPNKDYPLSLRVISMRPKSEERS